MGFFDFLKGAGRKVPAAAPGAGSGGGAVAASSDEESAVSSLLGEGGGQLSGLLEKFNVGGLGNTVQSWIGKGANLPVNADQIKAVLGSDQVAAVAGKLGISTDAAADKIANLLPGVIDKLTPDGIVPDPSALANKLSAMIKK